MITDLLWFFFFTLMDSFFNGSETIMVSINRILLHSKLESGNKQAAVVEKLLKNSESVISSFLIGINISDVAMVIFFTMFLNKVLPGNPFVPLIVTLVLTPWVSVVSTLIPKLIFRQFANKMVYPLAYLYYILYIILYPVQFIFVNLSKIVLRIAGIKKRKEIFSKEEFKILLDLTAKKGALNNNEKGFIEHIMDFKNIKAKEVMVPLIRMSCIEESDTVGFSARMMINTKHSRLPVFQTRVDNMVGYIENKDIVEAESSDKVKNYVKNAIFVPDIVTVNQVLLEMQKNMTQMAFAVDEYGGVSGVITNQDVITQIVGEFVEIHNNFMKKTKDGWIVQGIWDIDELNRELNLKIQKMDFETVAGYCIYRLQKMPKPGDSFEEGAYVFEILSSSHVRINQIRIYLKKKKKRKRQKTKQVKNESE